MKMIVGLGNIGTRYDETRHNAGFMVVEQLARDFHLGAFTHEKVEAVTVTGLINGQKVMLVKPTTFMNESGRAVKPLMEYYDIALDDLIVVSDDLDMPVGKIKLKQRGASGGHNGLKSLIDHLGTREFNRVKLGIDHPKFGSVVSHVLGRFDTEERPVFEGAVLQAEQALIKWVQGTSFDQLMNTIKVGGDTGEVNGVGQATASLFKN
ncbi:aminoacyl-tRNA hydrolase [Limosilactobacillus fermentum]|uniref:Peptidyl-tRNA hydrolase n=1 Tax=Limosilactobacillus fermentum TaxID=1613 RepID=A0AAJ5ZVW0_LIMFE|nr:aminoacyl-tRNA hydrolase [Limosilactobacillus fermentum]WFR89424.1 aminoacyl-tRNA hydrolase [Limosilactobacillus fermentum]